MSASMLVHHLIDVVLTAEPARAKESVGALGGLVVFFKDGGPFMFVNIFWLASAVAVASSASSL